MKELLALIAGLTILGFAYCHIRPKVIEDVEPTKSEICEDEITIIMPCNYKHLKSNVRKFGRLKRNK